LEIRFDTFWLALEFA
jgi:hypothetical protein